MDVSAKIIGIKYSPFLCRELKVYDFSNIAITGWLFFALNRSYSCWKCYKHLFVINFKRRLFIMGMFTMGNEENKNQRRNNDRKSRKSILGL